VQKIIILFFLFCCQQAVAQKTYLLRGTIGKYPIVMLLQQDEDASFSARYFYKSSLTQITQ
jgi:hypothetical protein